MLLLQGSSVSEFSSVPVPASDFVSEPDSVLSLISFADKKIGLLHKAVRG